MVLYKSHDMRVKVVQIQSFHFARNIRAISHRIKTPLTILNMILNIILIRSSREIFPLVSTLHGVVQIKILLRVIPSTIYLS